MEVALLYRWAVFILLSVGLVLLMKHGILTPFVFWSRIQYLSLIHIFWAKKLGVMREVVPTPYQQKKEAEKTDHI